MNSKSKNIIWTISGSDCSGGAGIAADIKTAHSFGVEICQLITANTVQNSRQLWSINAVAIEVLQQQLVALITDKPPTVIKIGLIANEAQVLWLAKALKQLKDQIPSLICVYDPIGRASVSGRFHQLTTEQLKPLLAEIDVITPNIPEAQNLATPAKQLKETKAAILAKSIHQQFAINSVIIKGGHSDNEEFSSDYCYHQLNSLTPIKNQTQQSIGYQLTASRVQTHFTHGTGCSFATALSALLAQGYLIRDAFTLTKAFMQQGLMASTDISAEHNHEYYGAFMQTPWPKSPEYFPKITCSISQKYQQLPAFSPLNLSNKKLGLYPVVNSIEWLQKLLPLGLEIIQLRVKGLSESAAEIIIKSAIESAKPYHTRLFINDYWQLAIKHGAYGVHIGQEDLQKADLTAIQQAGLRLGISTHGCYEFLLTQQLQPSYIAIGAIFPTKTKNMTGQIQGIENLKDIMALATNIPVVAIGGINLERAETVLATGVDSIAVVTAITEAKAPIKAVEAFQLLTNNNFRLPR